MPLKYETGHWRTGCWTAHYGIIGPSLCVTLLNYPQSISTTKTRKNEKNVSHVYWQMLDSSPWPSPIQFFINSDCYSS